ncbi:hypothetical protein BCR34DRAFT_591645 [Clohesyomyces aquaticus]|uniref:Uncharacterized protein n=1 Tax=Clohesyomyces aquaticus TaxID=1231657 RepID=A0A1Y1YYT9_9PLEO|nr:hypothetical protein BCR34DRAFT_591645 [Clohesyomyces aquaticus]
MDRRLSSRYSACLRVHTPITPDAIGRPPLDRGLSPRSTAPMSHIPLQLPSGGDRLGNRPPSHHPGPPGALAGSWAVEAHAQQWENETQTGARWGAQPCTTSDNIEKRRRRNPAKKPQRATPTAKGATNRCIATPGRGRAVSALAACMRSCCCGCARPRDLIHDLWHIGQPEAPLTAPRNPNLFLVLITGLWHFPLHYPPPSGRDSASQAKEFAQAAAGPTHRRFT